MVAQLYRDTVTFTPALREEWMDDAACVWWPVETFFPASHGSTAKAKEVCAKCDVRIKCLAFALRMEKGSSRRAGVYGGLGPGDREKLQNQIDQLTKEKK